MPHFFKKSESFIYTLCLSRAPLISSCFRVIKKFGSTKKLAFRTMLSSGQDSEPREEKLASDYSKRISDFVLIFVFEYSILR